MDFIFNLLDASVSGSASGSVSSPSSSGGSGIVMWIVLGVLLVGLFVFNYFSRKKQQKAAEEKMAGLVPGSKIKTIGLICGTVVSIDEVQNTVVIETGYGENKSYLTIDKSAIYQIFPEGSGVNGVNTVSEPAFESEPIADENSEIDGTLELDEVDEIDDEVESDYETDED